MALYEMRTYTLYVGKMAEAQKLYTELGFPALKKGGHDKNCMSSEHFGQLAWQFKRMSGSSGLKVQAAIAC